uniref:Immunoglobulin domain-containing protein n=1 Tax=Sinocyclocheilus anshuiensis TaxID=1608454 RepID=A0A671R162_9TELE
MIWRKKISQLLPVVYFCLVHNELFISFSGFFCVDIVEVSVMEGDPVTLNTDVETNQQEDIKWYFNDIRIAEISGDLSDICTDVQCNEGTERFRDRLKLDHQTGSLTIMNTRTTDSGHYELKIISSFSISEKTFNVTVYGESLNECLKSQNYYWQASFVLSRVPYCCYDLLQKRYIARHQLLGALLGNLRPFLMSNGLQFSNILGFTC